MTKRQESASHLLVRANQNQKSAKKRYFFSDLYDRLRSTPLYLQWQHVLTLTRRFRAVALTVRIFTILFTALQTGTFVLLSATLLLATLPLLLIGIVAVLLAAALASRHTNRLLSQQLAKKRIYVIFPEAINTPFLLQHVKDLRAMGYAVILVSPYLLSPTGIAGKGFYTTAREEYDNVFLIRRYYYFSFKRRVLADHRAIYQF